MNSLSFSFLVAVFCIFLTPAKAQENISRSSFVENVVTVAGSQLVQDRVYDVSLQSSQYLRFSSLILPFPQSFVGRFNGATQNEYGERFLFFDTPDGKTLMTSELSIASISSSTANIELAPSTNGFKEWKKELYSKVTDKIKTASDYSRAAILLLLLPLADKLDTQVYEELQRHPDLQLVLMSFYGYWIYSIISDPTRIEDFNERIKDIGFCFIPNHCFRFKSEASQHRFEFLLKKAQQALIKPNKKIQTSIISDETSGDMFIISVMGNNRPQEMLREKIVEAQKALLETNHYLLEIGLPHASQAFHVIINPSGLWSLNGPFAFLLHNSIYLGPSKKLFSSNDPTLSYLNPLIAGHELTHLALFNGFGLVEGSLAEALADYFPSSALNLEDPIIVFQGRRERELNSRENYDQLKESQLNRNSLGQMSGCRHCDSQVLSRFLWDLRSEFGRDYIDPLIINALKEYVKRKQYISVPKITPQKTVTPEDVIFWHQTEANLFIMALFSQFQKESEIETFNRLASKRNFPVNTLREIDKQITCLDAFIELEVISDIKAAAVH